MTEKEEKYIKIWKNNIEKGKTQYIIKTTIIWAFFVTLLTPFFKFLLNFDLTKEKLIEAYDIKHLLIQFVVFLIVGILFSFVMWKMNVKKYKQLTNQD